MRIGIENIPQFHIFSYNSKDRHDCSDLCGCGEQLKTTTSLAVKVWRGGHPRRLHYVIGRGSVIV